MSPTDNATLKNNPLLIGIVVFILLMILSQFLCYQKYVINKNNEHKLFIQAANTAKEQLETSLYHSVSATKTLGFIVEEYGIPQDFDAIAQPLIETNKYIDGIQLVNNKGEITHVYPLEENRLALGYNILEDISRNKEAYKAIENKEVFFAGPLELKQGGMAVIGRQPLFNKDKFIGFAATIIKLPTLIKATGIDFSKQSNFQYQLSKINPDTDIEEFFFPNSESFDKENAFEIVVPNGAWKLYVSSVNHTYKIYIALFILLGIIFSAIGGMFAWYIAKQPEVLRARVAEKTSEIKKVENRYRALVENSSHALIILNATGGLSYVSPSVKNILGYTEEEAMRLNMFEVLHPDDRAGVEAKMAECMQNPGVPIQGHISRTKHKDGSWRWLDATVINLFHDPNINGIIDNFKDVTASVNAENEIRWLINNTEEAFILLDKDLNIISFNIQYEKLYAQYFNVSVVKGKSILDYVLPERKEIVNSIYKKVLQGTHEESEITVDLPDGDKRIFSVKYKPALDQYENVIGVFVSGADVTEKVKAQQRIQQSKDELEHILDSSIDMICTLNMEGYFVKVSAASEKILGYTPEELEGKSFLEVIHPDDIEKTAIASVEIVAGKPNNNFENRYIKKDGTAVTLIWSVRYNEIDKIVYCVAKDATSIIEAEKQIRENEALMNEAQKIAKMGNWNFDFRTDRLTWSDALYDVFDANRETFKETHGSFVSLVDPDDRDFVLNTSAESQRTGEPFNIQYNITTTSGEKRIIEEFGYVEKDENGNVLRLYGTAQNITERKKAELEILQFKKIVESSKDGIAIANNMSKSIYINPSFAEVLGYTVGSLDHKGGPSYVYANKELASEVFGTLLSGNYWKGDVDLINSEGKILNFYLSGGPIFNDKNKLVAIYGIHTDISERKKVEHALKAAYFEKNTILESIGDGFFTVDKNFNVSYWNSQAENLLDISKEEIIGKNLWEVFSEAVNTHSYEYYHKVINEHVTVHFEEFYKPVNKWFEISAYPAESSMSVYFKDITEKKKAEALLTKINKSLELKTAELTRSNAELEQFAYVASHDLQEPLRMVTSFLSKIEQRYNDLLDERGKKYIHLAVDGAVRMRKIILDILEYSRSSRLELNTENVDVSEIILDVIKLYGKTIHDLKAIITHDEMPVIKASPTALNQILRNLIGNALKYSKTDVAPQIHVGYKETNTHWQFYVKDNGIGVSSEFFDKLFILFQRLHENNEYSGSGIGLAVCKKLVERHEGEIWLASQEGIGSTFYFTIKKQLESL